MYQQPLPEYEHSQPPMYSVYTMQPMNWMMVSNDNDSGFTHPHLPLLDMTRQEAPVPPMLWQPTMMPVKKEVVEERWYGAMGLSEYGYYENDGLSRTACSSPLGACDGNPFFRSAYANGDCGSTSTSTSTSNSSNQPSPVQDNMEFTQHQQHQQQPMAYTLQTSQSTPPTQATSATSPSPSQPSTSHTHPSIGHYASALPGTPLSQPAEYPAATGTSDARPFPCYACARAFARKHDLQRHIRVHTGDKPYSCSCCKKAFARTDALKRHLRMEEVCRNSPQMQATKVIQKKRYRHL